MTSTAKHYVSVAQAMEMLRVSERSVRRWIAHDPPLLHAIKDPSGHLLVDLDDIHAIQEQKPELKNPLPDRVEEVEEDVQTLKGEVEALKQQITTLLALSESAGGLPASLRRERASAASGASARGYPPGTLRLIEFTEKHQVNISEIKELHWQGAIAVSIYDRERAKRNAREWWITPDQHRAVVTYYQQHGLHVQTERCDFCSAAS